MAKLHEDNDSDEEFPELSTIIGPPRKTHRGQLPSSVAACGQERRETAPETAPKKTHDKPVVASRALAERGPARASHDEKQIKKQRPLKIAHVNTLLLPISSASIQRTESVQKTSDDSDSEEPVRPTPRRVAKKQIDYSAFTSALSTALDSDDDQSFDDLSDFIVRDSDSELDARFLESSRTYVRGSPKKLPHAPDTTRSSTINTSQPEVIDLISPDKTGRGASHRKSRITRNNDPTDTQEKGVSSTEDPPATLRL